MLNLVRNKEDESFSGSPVMYYFAFLLIFSQFFMFLLLNTNIESYLVGLTRFFYINFPSVSSIDEARVFNKKISMVHHSTMLFVSFFSSIPLALQKVWDSERNREIVNVHFIKKLMVLLFVMVMLLVQYFLGFYDGFYTFHLCLYSYGFAFVSFTQAALIGLWVRFIRVVFSYK